MSVYDPEESTLSAWGKLVEKQSKGSRQKSSLGIPLRVFR